MKLRSVAPSPLEFALNTNLMASVPQLAHAETVFDEGGDGSGRSQKFRLEQKFVDLIGAFLQKFTKPVAMVLDRSFGTGSTTKSCLLES